MANANLEISNSNRTLQADLTHWTLANSSSRRPIRESIEIKPGIAASGVDTFTALPSWNSYHGVSGGTSSAAPHVAGLPTVESRIGIDVNETARPWFLCTQIASTSRYFYSHPVHSV